MQKSSLVRLPAFFAIILGASFAGAQEVHVSPVKGGVVMTIEAKKPYALMAGEEKTSTMSLECVQKGKKAVHLLIFSPGEAVAEDNPETGSKGGVGLYMTMGGTRQRTSWIAYNDPDTYAYYGKTEPERVQFIESLFKFDTASIEFKPFLTGAENTSVFDVGKLREEMLKHPECSMQ